ncbi:MAG: polar amino acid transport system substrate-binding protein [Yoonia sp.]|jgi:polar amino acid transport system substrate-binding protein
MTSFLKTMATAAAAASFTLVGGAATPVSADELLDRANDGGKIRIGFANEPPWAYPGENNEALGFVHVIVTGALENMGISADRVEPVVTDWGGLIPGLKANRYDIITGGMYILETRCENVSFSEPFGAFADVFVVRKGNPKNIHTYQDIKREDAVLVTGAGYNIVEFAQNEGVPDANVMQVPGPTEMLAAFMADRADAIGSNFFAASLLVEKSNGTAELSDPSKLPDWALNWGGIGFRQSDTDFLAAFNTAMAEYMGSEDMMSKVAEYGYTEDTLPGDAKTSFACENR